MDSSFLKDAVGNCASITTIIQYLSGVLVCRTFVVKKSTGDSSPLTFVSGFLACCLWLKYGLLINESTIILVNVVGAVLFFIYLAIFYIITVNKRQFLKQFLVTLVIITLASFYDKYETDSERASQTIGIICCSVAVFFFASPLTNLAHVIKTKNTESLPFPIILTSFFLTLLWFIYGYLINDTFIQIPNFLGCVLSSVQLSLFIIYPTTNYKPLNQVINF